MWPGLHQHLHYLRQWTRPISNDAARGLKEHLRQGVTGATLLSLVASVSALYSFLRHGGQLSALFWVMLALVALQLALLWRVRRPSEQYHGALGLVPICVMAVVHMMLNLNLEMARANGALIHLGMPVILAAFFPLAPTRLLLVGLSSTSMAVSILHHALDMPLWILALVALLGVLFALLGALASQQQRHTWLRLERKRVQVSAQERLSELGQRTAGMVHALGTPASSGLDALKGACALQRELAQLLDQPQGPRQELHRVAQQLGQALGHAQAQGHDLGQALQKLRDRTCPVRQQQKGSELGALLQRLALTARHKHPGLKVEVRAPQEPIELQERGAHLAQVLEQLIQNTAEAIERHGVGDSLCLEADAGRGWLRVTVRDNGAGVPEALRPNLFVSKTTQQQRAQRASAQDAGLGLPICRDIVRGKLRGELKLLPTPAGACFEIKLPLEARPAPARERAEAWVPSFKGQP
jgi:signal transduction histidine kinase